MPDQPRIWVFHAGALGDFVLTWPLLRAFRAAGAEVTVVSEGGKARLAGAELGVRGADAEQRRFTRLWTGAGAEPVRGVDRVITLVADPSTESGDRWHAGARAMFPGAAIDHAGPPGTESRRRLWAESRAGELGRVRARSNPGGPVVVHTGAGARDKQWPLERWRVLAAALGRLPGEPPVVVIAGEAEAERMSEAERAIFADLGGRLLTDLDSLASHLRAARLMVGADTGPTHLAAQLGVRTVALFGPTDPRVWSPQGPAVRVLAPAGPAPMGWLEAPAVVEAVGDSLSGDCA